MMQQQQGGMPSRDELMAQQQQAHAQQQPDMQYQQNAGLQDRQANTIDAIKQQAYQQGVEATKQQLAPQIEQMQQALQQQQGQMAQQEQAHGEQMNAIGQDREQQLDEAHQAGSQGRIAPHQKEAMMQALQSKVQNGEMSQQEAQHYAQQLMNN